MGMGTEMKSKADHILERLMVFYRDEEHMRSFMNVKEKRDKQISLRMLEKFVTSYCPMHPVILPSTNRFAHVDYKVALQSHSKAFFDPFARKPKIEIPDGDGGVVSTTIGQLNFFRWAIETGLLEYVSGNIDMLRKEMLAAKC